MQDRPIDRPVCWICDNWIWILLIIILGGVLWATYPYWYPLLFL